MKLDYKTSITNKAEDNSFKGMLDEFFPEKLTPGQMMRAKRKNFDITLAEIEHVTGIKANNLSAYENDTKKMGLVQAVKIGAAIGLHPTSILFPNGIDHDERFEDARSKGKALLERKALLKHNKAG